MRISTALLFLSLGVFTGCSKDQACLDSISDTKICLDDAAAAGLDIDVDFSDPEGFCEAFSDLEDTVWDCQAKAARDADCTTNEGLDAWMAASDTCAGF